MLQHVCTLTQPWFACIFSRVLSQEFTSMLVTHVTQRISRPEVSQRFHWFNHPRKLLELHRPSTCDLGNNGVIHPVPQLCCLAKIWETYWRNVGSVTAICRISNSYNMLVIGNLPLELRLKMLFWMFAMIECLGVGNRVLPLAIWRMKQRAGVCRFHFGGAYCWTSRCSYLISSYFSDCRRNKIALGVKPRTPKRDSYTLFWTSFRITVSKKPQSAEALSSESVIALISHLARGLN